MADPSLNATRFKGVADQEAVRAVRDCDVSLFFGPVWALGKGEMGIMIWEYCSLVYEHQSQALGTDDFDASIMHFTQQGTHEIPVFTAQLRIQDVVDPSSDDLPAQYYQRKEKASNEFVNAIAKAIADLGRDGWEVIEGSPRTQSGHIFFKRQTTNNA